MFSRRAVIKGVASMYGLGRSDPSRFPYSQRPQQQGLAPGQGNVTRARVVIVSGPSGGVFVYAPGTVPGPGNPPIASMTAGTTDPFGNPVLPEITAYGTGGSTVQMLAGSSVASLLVGTGDAAETGKAAFSSTIAGSGVTRQLEALLRGPSASTTSPNDGVILFDIASGSVDQTSEQPFLDMIAKSNNGAQLLDIFLSPTVFAVGTLVTITVGGAAVFTTPITSTAGTAANPTVISTDTWQTVPSFGAGFAAGGPTPQYALMPFGVGGAASVAIRGQVLATAATAVGAPMFTLPYTFARQHDFVTPNNLAGAALGQRIVRVAASGAVQCQAVGANTNFIILDGIIANRG